MNDLSINFAESQSKLYQYRIAIYEKIFLLKNYKKENESYHRKRSQKNTPVYCVN